MFKKQDEYRLKKLAQSKISTESEYETNKVMKFIDNPGFFKTVLNDLCDQFCN